MNATFNLSNLPPAPDEFAALRLSVDWKSPNLTMLRKSIANSLFWISIYQKDKLVATGRVIGDGSMYFYIQDVIVSPQFQRQKLGDEIMKHIEEYLTKTCVKGSTIGLLSAFGKEQFYQRYGYTARDGETLGLGMCKFL